MAKEKGDTYVDDEIVNRIVNELLVTTTKYVYQNGEQKTEGCNPLISDGYSSLTVTKDEISKLPITARPQLTGSLMASDLSGPPSYIFLLSTYKDYLNNKDNAVGRRAYQVFRQGVDLLDLDAIIYQVLGMNKNTMGYWLPLMAKPMEQGGFKIPNTTIIKVPLPVLQLTRLEYSSLTPATMAIVDKFCYKAFDLKDDGDYFVKTGTFSSKYDFRNAHVVGANEVRELGEYLLFINNQAVQMAGYDTKGRVIYGVSTTNEWVVRDFIKDVDDRPTIYNGLPLRTEYRIFVDFDIKKVVGIHAYWDAKTIKNRFDNQEDSHTPKMMHDSITYRMCEDDLQADYEENKNMIVGRLNHILQTNDIPIEGQWSIDIMQNGDDFWFIDMAHGDESAFYKESVPEELRKFSYWNKKKRM